MATSHNSQSRSVDISGQRFGRLVAVRRFDVPVLLKSGRVCRRRWVCMCDCGTEKVLTVDALVSGDSKSCGCLKKDATSKRKRTHGMSRHCEYNVWNTMLRRCLNKRAAAYKNYGARGISVSDTWRGPGGFSRFLADMGHRPSPRHSLERINNDGDYQPGNVRWATPSEQAQNRRNTRFLIIDGQKRPACAVAREHGIAPDTFNMRVNKLGWDLLIAATQPIEPRHMKAARTRQLQRAAKKKDTEIHAN